MVTTTVRKAGFERRFYLTASVGFAALVAWTFARTYYLKAIFHTPELSWLIHVHGIAMTGWVVLLALQSALIASGRVRLHRRIGVFGAGWAAFVVVLGSVTTLHAGAREVHAGSAAAAGQLVIMGLDLLQMLLFGIYVTLAIAWRRRPDVHKRLMLLTIACMLPDALARLPGDFMTNFMILVGINLFVVASVAVDTVRHRRLHPAFGWGAGAFVVLFNLALPAMQTHSWIAFATWLVR